MQYTDLVLMDIKHINCFGPRMVDEWNLHKWSKEILDRWNDINLYTLTRGINRFKGLETALVEVNEKYRKIEGLDTFVKWVNETTELSKDDFERIKKVLNIQLGQFHSLHLRFSIDCTLRNRNTAETAIK